MGNHFGALLTPRVVEADAVVQDEQLNSRLQGILFRRLETELGLGNSPLTAMEARPRPPLGGAPGEKVPGVFESLEAWGLSSMCLRGRDVRDVS